MPALRDFNGLPEPGGTSTTGGSPSEDIMEHIDNDRP